MLVYEIILNCQSLVLMMTLTYYTCIVAPWEWITLMVRPLPHCSPLFRRGGVRGGTTLYNELGWHRSN